MFTGIIEETGVVRSISKSGNQAVIVVDCAKVLEGTKIGDSISINGVCQTVTSLSSNSFSAEASEETLKLTTFLDFKPETKVNLERALTLQSRLGGHFVTGHIDGKAKVKKIQRDGNFYNLEFEAEKDNSKYIVKKGSVTLNGISLTVADICGNDFTVAVIPHTYQNTALKYLRIGAFVNIETDILAKYVEKFLSTGNNSSIDENFLKENGFF